MSTSDPKPSATGEGAHTPGPWYSKPFDEGQIMIVPERHQRQRHALICTVSFGAMRPDGEMNARLIAAAPDLMAVAERVVQWMDDNGYSKDDQSFGARAALAHAKKGTP